MNVLNEIKTGPYDESTTKFRLFYKEIVGMIRPWHEKNVNHGGEFIDDAIRTKDQPLPFLNQVYMNRR